MKHCIRCSHLLVALCVVVFPLYLQAGDQADAAWKAIGKITLDQPETHPFHLKAAYAPSYERDRATGHEGTIEIWWQSPELWRRELSAPGFHQVAIFDGKREWQKNEGEYFPEWLLELTNAIMRPMQLEESIFRKRVLSAEVRHLMRQTNIEWEPTNEFDNAQANGKGYLALNDDTGLPSYMGGLGFGGNYHDYKKFHDRSIARKVASGSIELTATIDVFEDLAAMPDSFFDPKSINPDATPIYTAVLSEEDLRKSLQPGATFTWPTLNDGPFEGVAWTEVVLDRTGSVRELIPPICDNPGVSSAADAGFRSMHFAPILKDGVAVQAMGRLSVRFKVTRPAGTENFASAKEYFERGRKASFLAAGSSTPYHLHISFQTGTSKGLVSGSYEDTWISDTEWKREAWIGSSHLVKSQSGEQHYILAEGDQAQLLRMMMQILEPIPAEDTMTESDWRIRRDITGDVNAIRVYSGPEGPNGELDPGKSQAYWFDDQNHLLKCFMHGLEIYPSRQEEYNGVLVARQIDVVKNGHVGMRLLVDEIGPADPSLAKTFKLKGYEWQRAFTAEAR